MLGRGPGVPRALSSSAFPVGLSLGLILAWATLLALTVIDPPVDNIEQLTWVRSMQWGYFKHPPLPTWLLWPFVQLFGLHAPVAALLGAVVQGGALLLWWDLLRRLAGLTVAGLSLLGALCIAHHSLRLHHYNHNALLLLASVAAAWFLWRAWEDGRRRWWLGLGVAFGLGLLAKYQMVASILAALLFVAWGVRHRAQADARALLKGLALALLVAGVVVAPHLHWLSLHPANPLGYAAESTVGAELTGADRWRGWGLWLGELVTKAAGAVVLVGGLCLIAAIRLARPGEGPPPARVAQAAAPRALILIWLFTPLALITGMSLGAGAAIRPHWAMSLSLWAVPWALMAIGPQRLKAVPQGWVVVLVILVQGALVLQHLRVEGPTARDQRPARWGQPMAERWAAPVAEAARRELGGDIRLVIGPQTVAAAFALATPERPYVLLDGRRDISPWVPHGLMERCGVLFIAYEPPGPQTRAIDGAPEGIIWRVAPAADGRGCTGDEKRPLSSNP